MGMELLPLTHPRRNPPLIRVDRAQLEALIENAIAMLDDLDGDFDLEDGDDDRCITGDDGMHRMFVNGRWHWGSQEDEHDQAPDYGVDQTNIKARPW